MKILCHARIEDAHAHHELLEQVTHANMRARAARLVIIDVVSFVWNCAKHITPRYSVAEVEEFAGSLKTRIAELEAQLRPVKS